MAQKEQDASIQEIHNRLILAGIDADTADGLIQSAKAPYDSDRKERGVRRIKRSGPRSGWIGTDRLTGLLSGIFVLLGVALTLAGLFQLGKGIYEVKGVKGVDKTYQWGCRRSAKMSAQVFSENVTRLCRDGIR